MTIDATDCKLLYPSEVGEAWCHQRGCVCFIEELHKFPVKAGDSFGAAYFVGWFENIEEMKRVYDEHKAKTKIVIEDGKFHLECDCD